MGETWNFGSNTFFTLSKEACPGINTSFSWGRICQYRKRDPKKTARKINILTQNPKAWDKGKASANPKKPANSCTGMPFALAKVPKIPERPDTNRTKDKETSETRSSFMTYTAKAAMRNKKGKRNTVLPNSQRKTENRKLPAVPAFSKNAKTNMTAKAKKKTPQSIRTPFSGREKWKGRLGRNAPFLCLPFLLCITPLYPRTKTFSTAKLLLHPNFTPRGCTVVYTI